MKTYNISLLLKLIVRPSYAHIYYAVNLGFNLPRLQISPHWKGKDCRTCICPKDLWKKSRCTKLKALLVLAQLLYTSSYRIELHLLRWFLGWGSIEQIARRTNELRLVEAS